MHQDLYRRWSHEMQTSGLFRPGERVGVAVSGGPDSVLLFEFLKQLSGEMGLVLAVVHFNHRLRGSESDADEEFVRELARGSGERRVTNDAQEAPSSGSSLVTCHSSLNSQVEFIRAEAHVGAVAREKRRNLEATARELRYSFFFSLVDEGRLDKVATAHTANDQAETVLLRLLRGTGTRGLGGIHPVLEGKVVRPFLGLTRAEVEAEVARRGLAFRVDSSNRDARLARNKIRLELLPALAREFNPAVVKLLKDFADQARDDEACLEQQAAELAQAWRVREGAREKIPSRALVSFPPAIEGRVLRQMIAAVRGHLRGVTREHVEALRRFARESQSGRRLVLPGRVTVRKDFEWLVVEPGRADVRLENRNPKHATPAGGGECVEAGRVSMSDFRVSAPTPIPGGFAYPVPVPGIVEVPELKLTFHFKIVATEEKTVAYNDNGAVYLDGRKLAGKLILRNWQAGDRFRPFGSRRARKLKELFRQRRIDAVERSRWPVLECGGEVVWVRGFSPPAGTANPEAGPVMTIEEIE